jgi:hypothetical protein
MSTQTIPKDATQISTAATVDLKLEVVVIPVSDVDRTKRFYQGLGWRLDADFSGGDHWRGVQMTPPGSACSIHFGKGITTAAPGSAQNLYLVSPTSRRHEPNSSPAAPTSVRRSISTRLADLLYRAATRTIVPTGRMRHSAIRTATAGCCRRSQRGFPVGASATSTSPL